MKYQNLSHSDFDIESVEPTFDLKKIIPENYEDTAVEDIPKQKIKAQLRSTVSQLEVVISEHLIRQN